MKMECPLNNILFHSKSGRNLFVPMKHTECDIRAMIYYDYKNSLKVSFCRIFFFSRATSFNWFIEFRGVGFSFEDKLKPPTGVTE